MGARLGDEFLVTGLGILENNDEVEVELSFSS